VTTRRRAPKKRRDSSRWYPLVGTIAAITLVVLVYISYNATSGVPGQKAYTFDVQLRDADRLVKANQVRIAGVRRGQISTVEAVTPDAGGGTPFSKVTLRLDGDVPPLPVDTTAKVRPASILGSSYLDLVPGRSARTIPEGGTLALKQAQDNVELTDLLDVFEAGTSKAIQGSVSGLGGSLAGRGDDLGRTVTQLKRLTGPLSSVSEALAAPDTRLAPFIAAYDRTVREAGGVAPQLGDMFGDGATTFSALDGSKGAIQDTLDRLPASARASTAALRSLRPALDDIAEISKSLRPAARRVPAALTQANDLFRTGIPTLDVTPRFAAALSPAVNALKGLSELPSTEGALRRAGDLMAPAQQLTKTLGDAQVHCNAISLFGRGWTENWGLGTGDGPSIANILIKSTGAGPQELLQNPKPLDNLHANYNPKMNEQECEAGNEIYDPAKQVLGNPPGLQSNETVGTFIVPETRQRWKNAGLLDDPPAAEVR
jgi:virulence factor Mce-like protein